MVFFIFNNHLIDEIPAKSNITKTFRRKGNKTLEK